MAAVGGWQLALKRAIQDPAVQVYADDLVVAIEDKYPKVRSARYHFLVLPREDVPTLKSLRAHHVPLLQHMEREGQRLADSTKSDVPFRLGYHSVPSLPPLHLHVISQDFVSPCLKTKKHWNSFTTEYFLESRDAIRQLDDEGTIRTLSGEEARNALGRVLKCHVCAATFSTMPKLKAHVQKHAERYVFSDNDKRDSKR